MHSPDTRQVHRPTVVASGGAPAAPAPELTRRVFLNRFSVGAGAVIVVAGGGLTLASPSIRSSSGPTARHPQGWHRCSREPPIAWAQTDGMGSRRSGSVTRYRRRPYRRVDPPRM